ncbi:hypothetical protein TNCV_1867851 [Trichonephila clavipes]|nr:hypothetical protein TNCV_1867851 [Trichonephila clavipes]
MLHTAFEKCVCRPSWMNHTFCCEVAGTPGKNSRRVCSRKRRYFGPLRSLSSICTYPHSFGDSFHLFNRPPNGCLVWRHRVERTLEVCFRHRHTGPSPGVMVWDATGYTFQ